MTASRAAHLFQRVRAEHDEDDAHLLARFAAGRDATAFAALVRRHGPLVLGVCRRTLGRVHDAEDAFQAVFLVLAQKAGQLRDTRLLSAWLYGVAWRVAKKAKRRAARRREEHPAVLPEPVTADAAMSAANDWGPVLDEELAALPAAYRDAILACDVGQLSRADAAAKLGVAEGTLSSRLAAGRKKLADRLARRGVTLSLPLLAALGTAGVSEALVQQTLETMTLWATGGAVPRPITELTHGGFTMMRNALLAAGSLIVAGAVGVGLAEDPPKKPPEPPKPAEAKAETKPAEVVAKYAAPRMKKSLDLAMEGISSLAWTPDGKRFVVRGTGEFTILQQHTTQMPGGTIVMKKLPVGTPLSGLFFYPANLDQPAAEAAVALKVAEPKAAKRSDEFVSLTSDGTAVAVVRGQSGRINSQRQLLLVPVYDKDGRPLAPQPAEDFSLPRTAPPLPLEPEYAAVLGFTNDRRSVVFHEQAGGEKPTNKLVLRSAETGEVQKTLLSAGLIGQLYTAKDFTRIAYPSVVETKAEVALGFPGPGRVDRRVESITLVLDAATNPTTRTLPPPDKMEPSSIKFGPTGDSLVVIYSNAPSRSGLSQMGGNPLNLLGGGEAKANPPTWLAVGYDVASGRELFRLPSGVTMSRAEVSADGRLLAVAVGASGSGSMVIYDTADGTVLKRWPLPARAPLGSGQPRPSGGEGTGSVRGGASGPGGGRNPFESPLPPSVTRDHVFWAFSPREPKLLIAETGDSPTEVSVGLWEFPAK